MPDQDPRSYWDTRSEIASRISLAVLAYAAGDAFGVQFEFGPKIVGEAIHELKEKEGWPKGGVSDDTLLSVLTILSLENATPLGAREKFLHDLQRSISKLRGLGPTTRSALGLPVKARELSEVGISNGGMMRTALVGLAFRSGEDDLRREWIAELTKATHTNPVAIDCAVLLSKAFSQALELGSEGSVSATIFTEVNHYSQISAEVRVAVENFNSWSPPEAGISNNSLESLLAVMYVLERATSVKEAYSLACKLGGDTDTIAALSGALYEAAHNEGELFFQLPWLNEINFAEVELLSYAIGVLVSLRISNE